MNLTKENHIMNIIFNFIRLRRGFVSLLALFLLLSTIPLLAATGTYSGYPGSGGYYSGGNPLNPFDGVEPECIDDGEEESGSCTTCTGNTKAGSGMAQSQPRGIGMPRWRVSEPILDVFLEDRPFFYQPSRGPAVAFDLWFKNMQGTNNVIDNAPSALFSVGTNWHTPWRSYLRIPPTPGNVLISHRGSGDARKMQIDSLDSDTRIYVASESSGFSLTYPDGAYELFSEYAFHGGEDWYLLSERRDRHGHPTYFQYETSIGGDILLTTVTDVDGLETTFEYASAGPYSSVITKVVNLSLKLTNTLAYDNLGRLTNITDMAGLSTGIAYDTTNNLRQLNTPYGATTFSIWGAQTNWAALRIAEMGLRTNFWLYLDEDTGARMSTNFSAYAPTLAGGLTDTFDSAESHKRNSFRWSQRQIELLSANFRTNLLMDSFDPGNVTSNDFKIARQRHWLRRVPDTVVSRTLSFERAVSHDGVADGQITWLDYEGKPSGTNWMEGTIRAPRSTAWKLPDATSRYTYWNRNSLGHPTNEFQTFETSGSLRSNRFEYAANGIDLTRHVRYVGATEKIVSSNTFNSAHQVLMHSNALNEVTWFTYDGSSRLTSITNAAGLLTTNFYGGDGFLSSTVNKDNATGTALRTNAYTWTNGLVLTHTDPRGAVTTNNYDALSRMTQTSDGLGTITYTYNNLDLIKTVDRMGFTRSNLFDPLRRLVRSADALNNKTSYRYCSCGSLSYATNALGEVMQFAYDKAGRLTTTFHPDGYNVTNTFDPMGVVSKLSDNAGSRVTNTYNQQGLLIRAETAYGRLFDRSFDIEDQLFSSTDANGVTVTNLFDALGRVFVRGLQATNSMEGFAWSPRGLLRHTNQLGHVTTNGFDALGRKVGETNANGEAVRFAYAPGGELLTLTDGKDQVTTWKYDLWGRVTNKADNLGTNVFVYRYDANSRLTYRWTPAKGDTGYTNDANGNVTLVNYSNSTDIVMNYDALNRLTNMVDAVGTNRYTYNIAGLLASEDGPWDSDTVSYTYTTGRQRSKMSLLQPNASAWDQTYAYDLARRLTNTTSPAGASGYNYAAVPGAPAAVPARLIQKLTLPSGAYITNGYDTVARLVNTVLKSSSHSPLNSHTYELNAGHQRTKQTRTDGDYADYTYDPLGQLKTALSKESGGSTDRLQEQFRYSYDAAGNLSNRVQNVLTNTFNVNSLNELTTVTRTTNFTLAGFTTIPASSVTVNSASVTPYADNTFAKDNLALVDGNNTFTAIATDSNGRGDTNAVTLSLPASVSILYDLNGNLRTNGTRVFDYDDENQLVTVTEPNTFKSEFSYDGKLRRRIRKEYEWRNSAWVKTNEVRYVYDGNLQERNEFNLATKTFTRGVDLSGTLQKAGGIGGLLSFTDHTLAATYHIDYHADGNGNVTALLDRNQKLAALCQFDPFGNSLKASGPLADANLYRFSSKEFHFQSGLVYYLYRYYAPNLQRWVNRDPIREQGGLNLYRFVRNNSLNDVDSYGLLYLIGAPVAVAAPSSLMLPAPNPVSASVWVFIGGLQVGYAIGDVTGLHDGLGTLISGPDPGPAPLPFPPGWTPKPKPNPGPTLGPTPTPDPSPDPSRPGPKPDPKDPKPGPCNDPDKSNCKLISSRPTECMYECTDDFGGPPIYLYLDKEPGVKCPQNPSDMPPGYNDPSTRPPWRLPP
jgi:RHS repeat-associated protein